MVSGQIPVDVVGARTATAPATWGQRTTWDDVQFFLPEPQWWFVIKRSVAVPDGLGLDGVLEAVRELASRHEALRTHLAQRPDGLVQWVQDGSRLSVELIEDDSPDDDGAPAPLQRHIDTTMSQPVDHERELPLRVAVGTRAGRPVTVVLAVSHVVADVRSANLLAAELAALLAAGAAGEPPPAHRAAWQPVDVAAAEGCEAGTRLAAKALDRFRRQLRELPQSVLGEPPPSGPVSGRPHAQGATLRSRAAPPALRVLADRYRTSSSTVLLAVTSALLRTMAGTRLYATGLICNNRSERMLRHAVGNLSQTVLATVPVADGPFEALVAAAADAALSAYRHGRFDPSAHRAAVGLVEAERGAALDLDYRFNDMWSAQPEARGQGSLAEPSLIRAAAADSTVVRFDGNDRDRVAFFVETFGSADELVVTVLADARRFPAERLPDFLRGLDAALVGLTERPMTVAQVGGCATGS